MNASSSVCSLWALIMGCGASSSAQTLDDGPAKPGTGADRTNATPISPTRQKEAAANFGMTQHDVIRPLGVGGTGETYLCKRRDNGKEEAVKVIKRPIPSVLQNLITNEVILQASLGEGHVNIVNAHELMLTDTHLCLFMEYISGGTLTDYVSARCDTADQRHGLCLDEDEARFLFRQCIEAVDYCHQQNVAHRDLKLDNTLLNSSDPPHVKICDFGFAKLMGSNNLMTNIGTPVYMAPQQIQKGKKGYDGRAADVWACGVLLFVMLLGAFPFEHSTSSAADEQRAFNEVHFEQIRIHWTENERNRDIVQNMSPECVDLLNRIFQINESKRIKIEEIRKHPWYVKPLAPRYETAMRDILAEQESIAAQLRMASERGLTSKQDTIRAVVAKACETTPSAGDNPYLGQEIMLSRLSQKLATMQEHPDE